MEGSCEYVSINETYTVKKPIRQSKGTLYVGGCSEERYSEMKHLGCENLTGSRVESISLVTDPADHVDDRIEIPNFTVHTVVNIQGIQPWDIEPLPSGGIIFTTHSGDIYLLRGNQSEENLVRIGTIEGLYSMWSAGLLGLEVHPSFPEEPYIYVYYSYRQEGDMFETAEGRARDSVWNRISRFKLNKTTIKDEDVLIDRIPGSIDHAGGRLEFGPDAKLYATTGDARLPVQASNRSSLAGKVVEAGRKPPPGLKRRILRGSMDALPSKQGENPHRD